MADQVRFLGYRPEVRGHLAGIRPISTASGLAAVAIVEAMAAGSVRVAGLSAARRSSTATGLKTLLAARRFPGAGPARRWRVHGQRAAAGIPGRLIERYPRINVHRHRHRLVQADDREAAWPAHALTAATTRAASSAGCPLAQSCHSDKPRRPSRAARRCDTIEFARQAIVAAVNARTP